ncbi:D-glycero-alpha-D-manno-heptose-1,7-bisphosphate 7-phosphatase [Saliterribacillus persicus]|uniref:D,D-heptose 1,7-bisphosphate phosphatase n=1 Tax=Saliterribacillus persicus TaxID=930114 RepID=A0A368X9C1_9BACI|nr:HAD-IIIA family hydrolase [Saliterribacillus persicus]RCW64540.1 D-alpha,beta-D-heptose 1,7-bisphosphate phosphatase [Saliterribacillus persicus]
MKVAFFDRDGTIIEDYPDHEWTSIMHPVFIDGAINTLKEVISKGYKVIIVTNQYIINEGYITLEQYHNISDQIIRELKIHDIDVLDVFYCPHAKNEGCQCMKPRNGMIQQAIEKYPNIKLKESFMIGDSAVDIELAIRMKIKGFGIGVGAGYEDDNIVQLKNISELVQYI